MGDIVEFLVYVFIDVVPIRYVMEYRLQVYISKSAMVKGCNSTQIKSKHEKYLEVSIFTV